MGKKMKLKLWDASETLDTDEDIKLYLNEAFLDGDIELIKLVLSDVAKAKIMTEIANKMGINRRALYKMLQRDEHIEYEDIYKILEALGVSIPTTLKMPLVSQISEINYTDISSVIK